MKPMKKLFALILALVTLGMLLTGTELQLRRIPIEETANNTLEIASLVQALGQPNTGASRVFWDKQTETRGEQSPDNEFTLVIPVNF